MRKGGKLGLMAILATLLVAMILAWWIYPMGAGSAGSSPGGRAGRQAPGTMPAGANAVESYRRAIALLEDLRSNPALAAQLDRYLQGQFDDEAAKFFAEHGEIARWVRAGVTASHADWGKRSMEQRLKELNGLRQVAVFTLAHSRYAAPEAQTSLRLDDTLAAMVLGRHISSEAVITNKLVEIGIELKAIDTLAAGLGTLQRDWLSDLPRRLDALPRSSTGKDVTEAEAILSQELLAQQSAGFIVGSMGRGLAEFYQEIGAVMDSQSPSEFTRTVDGAMAGRSLNQFVQMNGKQFIRLRETMAVMEAKRAMLRAAVRICLDGDSAAAQSKDPSGEGPFQYTKSEDGFELSSKLTDRGGAVKLVVGGK